MPEKQSFLIYFRRFTYVGVEIKWLAEIRRIKSSKDLNSTAFSKMMVNFSLITELKKIVKTTEYGYRDNTIRDKIIIQFFVKVFKSDFSENYIGHGLKELCCPTLLKQANWW